jgi:hypothetical protein
VSRPLCPRFPSIFRRGFFVSGRAARSGAYRAICEAERAVRRTEGAVRAGAKKTGEIGREFRIQGIDFSPGKAGGFWMGEPPKAAKS